MNVKLTVMNNLSANLEAFIFPVLTETPTTFTPQNIVESPFVKLAKLEPLGGRSSSVLHFSIPFYKFYELTTAIATTNLLPV